MRKAVKIKIYKMVVKPVAVSGSGNELLLNWV